VISQTVSTLMPGAKADLARLVAIPSISSPGYPEPRKPILDAYDVVVGLLRDAGVEDVHALELPDTAPVVVGGIPAPDGAPTVLLYSHYDVVAPGDESLWSSEPFTASERDGAIYGRGAADSKSNVVAHAAALRAFGGRPPVGIKVVI
jgi:acetylornithine deacetylase/succinyl-diaminopimelate desuccinylase-like protein